MLQNNFRHEGSNRRPMGTTQHYLPLQHFLVVSLLCETFSLCLIFSFEILYIVVPRLLTISCLNTTWPAAHAMSPDTSAPTTTRSDSSKVGSRKARIAAKNKFSLSPQPWKGNKENGEVTRTNNSSRDLSLPTKARKSVKYFCVKSTKFHFAERYFDLFCG